MSDPEIDVDALQEEVSRIKDAMGIEDRYPAQFKLWLVYGAVVAIAAAASQFVVLNRLPGWYHAVIWFVLIGGGGVYAGWRGDDSEQGTASGKPNVQLQFGSIFAYYLVIIAVLNVIPDVSYVVRSALVFGMIVGLLGVAYIVVGASLAAYYIRKRDRYAFYAGGVWMFALAVAVVIVPVLQRWGYAVFGGLYFVHSIASYLLLKQ